MEKNSKFNLSKELTKEESEFILTKLRSASYIGNEFEIFYNIYRKIGQHVKTL